MSVSNEVTHTLAVGSSNATLMYLPKRDENRETLVGNNSNVHKQESESEVTRSCLILCDPMDCSLPGSSIHGIFQARVLEWVAISFSRDPDPGMEPVSPASPALAGGFFTAEPLKKPC